MRFSVALVLGFWVFQFLDEFSLLFMSDSSHLFFIFCCIIQLRNVITVLYILFFFFFFTYCLKWISTFYERKYVSCDTVFETSSFTKE